MDFEGVCRTLRQKLIVTVGGNGPLAMGDEWRGGFVGEAYQLPKSHAKTGFAGSH
jgi:hypothetical protein